MRSRKTLVAILVALALGASVSLFAQGYFTVGPGDYRSLYLQADGHRYLELTPEGVFRIVPGSGATMPSPGGTFAATITPLANDGAALGTGALAWSDLFLATGGVINWGNGATTLTHSTGLLTLDDALTVGGVLTVNGASSTFANGHALRTGTTAADTLLLQAYDVDGAAYTTLATLTAGNTPTLAFPGTVTFSKISALADQIVISDTTAGAGISIGGDTTLYRGAANSWVTDDSVVIGGDFVGNSLVYVGAASLHDRIVISPIVKGANQFDGVLSSADLTAGRAWTFPNLGGTVALMGGVQNGSTFDATGFLVAGAAGIDKTCGGPVISASFAKGILTAMTCTSEPQPDPLTADELAHLRALLVGGKGN